MTIFTCKWYAPECIVLCILLFRRYELLFAIPVRYNLLVFLKVAPVPLRKPWDYPSASEVSLNTLQWRHNEHECVSNHRRFDYLLNRLFRGRSKKISKLYATGRCEGNPPVTGGFPSQRASNAENVSIWWRHHVGVIWKLLLNLCEFLPPQRHHFVNIPMTSGQITCYHSATRRKTGWRFTELSPVSKYLDVKFMYEHIFPKYGKGVSSSRRTEEVSWDLKALGDLFVQHEQQTDLFPYSWWRHDRETLSVLLALCEGNSPVTGGEQRASNSELWWYI